MLVSFRHPKLNSRSLLSKKDPAHEIVIHLYSDSWIILQTNLFDCFLFSNPLAILIFTPQTPNLAIGPLLTKSLTLNGGVLNLVSTSLQSILID